MRFGKRLIDFKRLECGNLCLWQCLVWWHVATRFGSSEQRVRIGETGIREGVVWIFLNRLLVVVDCLVQCLPRSFVPVKSSFHVQLISFVVIGVMLGEALLFAGNPELEFIDNLTGNFMLGLQQL